MDSLENDQLHQIRIWLGVSEFEVQAMPNWVYLRLCLARRSGRFSCAESSNRRRILESAWMGSPESLGVWGTLAEDGERRFVLESADLDIDALDRLHGLLGLHDCSYCVRPMSWSAPGKSFRVVFQEHVSLPPKEPKQPAAFSPTRMAKARNGELSYNQLGRLKFDADWGSKATEEEKRELARLWDAEKSARQNRK